MELPEIGRHYTSSNSRISIILGCDRNEIALYVACTQCMTLFVCDHPLTSCVLRLRLRQSQLQTLLYLLVSQGVIAYNKGNPLLCYFSMTSSLRKTRSCKCCRRLLRLVLIRLFTSLPTLVTFFFVLCFCNKYILNFSFSTPISFCTLQVICLYILYI
jgi:hypothetical protein